MHLSLDVRTPALKISLRGICCALVFLMMISLSALTLPAQSGAESQRKLAERLFNEGRQLRAEGSKESLRQAIIKFAEAHPLFHALNDRARKRDTLIFVTYR